MGGVRVDVVGLDNFKKAMSTLTSFDTTNMLRVVGEVLHDDVLDRFAKGEAPDGSKWEESERAKALGGGKTLVDSGILRDSFSPQVTGDELLYGTAMPYAAVHQFGGEAGKNHSVTLPARPILGLEINQMNLIEETARDYMQALLP